MFNCSSFGRSILRPNDEQLNIRLSFYHTLYIKYKCMLHVIAKNACSIGSWYERNLTSPRRLPCREYTSVLHDYYFKYYCCWAGYIDSLFSVALYTLKSMGISCRLLVASIILVGIKSVYASYI